MLASFLMDHISVIMETFAGNNRVIWNPFKINILTEALSYRFLDCFYTSLTCGKIKFWKCRVSNYCSEKKKGNTLVSERS